MPEGTLIKDAASGKVIADMSGDNTRQVILRGGKGGQATSTMPHPPCRLLNMHSRDRMQ